MLEIRRVSKSFGNVEVLRDVSLSLDAGEYIAIMGDSGIGKSTLLNLIAGIERPDRGSIAFAGHAVEALDETARTRLRRARMGFVFQAFHLLPHLTVAQNVELPLVLNDVPADAAAARLAEVLAAAGLAALRERLPRQLSGGEMQRTAIARAIVHRPSLVLADEPTGNLDPAAADTVLALLREQAAGAGRAGILVTHSQRAAATAHRIVRLTRRGLEGAR